MILLDWVKEIFVIEEDDQSSEGFGEMEADDSNIYLFQPIDLSEVYDMASAIREHKEVVVNFRKLESSKRMRMIDVLSGVAYGCGREFEKTTAEVFVCKNKYDS